MARDRAASLAECFGNCETAVARNIAASLVELRNGRGAIEHHGPGTHVKLAARTTDWPGKASRAALGFQGSVQDGCPSDMELVARDRQATSRGNTELVNIQQADIDRHVTPIHRQRAGNRRAAGGGLQRHGTARGRGHFNGARAGYQAQRSGRGGERDVIELHGQRRRRAYRQGACSGAQVQTAGQRLDARRALGDQTSNIRCDGA